MAATYQINLSPTVSKYILMDKLEPLQIQNVLYILINISNIIVKEGSAREPPPHLRPPSPAGNGATDTKRVLALKSHNTSLSRAFPKASERFNLHLVPQTTASSTVLA